MLTLVDTDDTEIEEGDFVVISNSEDLAKEKQKGHGGWNPEMTKVSPRKQKMSCITSEIMACTGPDFRSENATSGLSYSNCNSHLNIPLRTPG